MAAAKKQMGDPCLQLPASPPPRVIERVAQVELDLVRSRILAGPATSLQQPVMLVIRGKLPESRSQAGIQIRSTDAAILRIQCQYHVFTGQGESDLTDVRGAVQVIVIAGQHVQLNQPLAGE